MPKKTDLLFKSKNFYLKNSLVEEILLINCLDQCKNL